MSRLAVRRRERRADQILNDGQRKTGSLTGSRLGEADQVPAGKRERNRLLLNRRRMRVAGVADRMEQFGREVEIRKGDTRLGHLFNHLSVIYGGGACSSEATQSALRSPRGEFPRRRRGPRQEPGKARSEE